MAPGLNVGELNISIGGLEIILLSCIIFDF